MVRRHVEGMFCLTRRKLLRGGLAQEWEMPVPGFCLLFNWHFRSAVTWSAANRSHKQTRQLASLATG